MTDLLMGIPGVGAVYPGIHVCALFSGPIERDRLLVQFLQEGLRHGDQCVCLMDELEPENMRQRAYGPAELGDTSRPGHLSLHSAPDAYLRDGELTPQQTISQLVPVPASTIEQGIPLLRAAGQMSQAPFGPGAKEFSAYESAVILILAELPTVFLCLYDMRRFGAGMLADVLKVHSRILLDGTVLYNPHSVAPPAGPDPARAAVLPALAGLRSDRGPGDDQWPSLTGAEVRIAGFIGIGMTNRETAHELIVSPHTVDAHLKHIYQKLGIHSRAELAVLSFRHGSPSD
ncbi:MEDS domain-containing protein [Microbacterium sp. SSM24]|uniref:MEDS domain-containing protein n=1 Tax=Microbacterium sp. SSM24 TaxID=2991714 RepID=UPI002227DA21|nr:MEDS domain-containing protein [Microbacterium sp. SSM24]MCW3493315.1 MEDS domain-containing protein [Microbacterium sp. SSM24]